MSCGNPASERDALMPRRNRFDKDKTCIKCRSTPGNILIRHAVYCKACFDSLTLFKLSKSLDPFVNPLPDGPRKKTLRPAGNLFMAFDGSLGATVMVDMVHQAYFQGRGTGKEGETGVDGGRKHPRHGLVWSKAALGYVELAGAIGREDKRLKAQEVAAKYPEFELVSLKIEDAFDPQWWARTTQQAMPPELVTDLAIEDLPFSFASPSSTPTSRLSAYLSSLPTPTARHYAIRNLTRLLLLYTARSFGASHLLLGTTATELSVNLISGIAQGAGFVIGGEVGEQWTPPSIEQQTPRSGSWNGAVRVVRPLREIGAKECAALARWRGLSVIAPGLEARAAESSPRDNASKGIDGLTTDFIVGLDKNYPSTVSTIAQTVNKLVIAPEADADGACVLCERPIQRGSKDWKSAISIRSSLPEAAARASATSLAAVPDACATTSPKTCDNSLIPSLCFACHTTFTSKGTKLRGAQHGNEPNVVDETTAPMPTWACASLAALVKHGPTRASRGEIVTEGDDMDKTEGEIWVTRKMGEEEMSTALSGLLLE